MIDWLGILILLAWAYGVVIAIVAAVLWRTITRPPRRTAGNALAAGDPIDPSELDLPYESHRYNLCGMATESWIITGNKPTGPITLVLHGWADSRWQSMKWLATLAAVSHHVVLIDLPAHGESTGRHCTWGPMEIDLTCKLVEHIRVENAGRPIMLMGYSFGGMIVIEAASRCDVDAVICDSVITDPFTTISRSLRRRRLPVWPTTLIVFAMMKLRWPKLRQMVTQAAASRLTCPLLVMHGEMDHLADADEARAIAEAAARGEIAVWPLAGHNESVELAPAAYTDRLGRFVESAVQPYHESKPTG